MGGISTLPRVKFCRKYYPRRVTEPSRATNRARARNVQRATPMNVHRACTPRRRPLKDHHPQGTHHLPPTTHHSRASCLRLFLYLPFIRPLRPFAPSPFPLPFPLPFSFELLGLNEEAAIEREIISCTLHEFLPKPACKIIALI